MGCSGYGFFALVLNFLAVACTFTALLTPLWVTNTVVDSSYNNVVKSAATGVGVWAICIDVKWDNTATLVKGDSTASNYNIKDCYAYFNALDRTIARFDGQLKFDKYDTSICDHFELDKDRAAGALGVMTGLRKDNMMNFLKKTCSSSGKAVLAMVVGMAVCLFLSFVILIFGVCCCDNKSCMIQMARFLVILSTIFSVVLSFLVFSQFTQLRYDEAVYHASLYLEIAAFVLALILTWAIEQHIYAGGKKQQTDHI
ncbi:unnamed protein product [Aphanomyces euteiches]|uniref:Claudin n=1 Tax=Aphanomyces euteiches TaxID=100861 RepID=A0A6G0XAH1_9STRA|nr:hypothetical protein Ae201684_006892 [Aphanomyces euteiches]KAH9087431.1 hypothetical protein Ae201684P_000840 [Aphanomyces euteiches]KAH9158092.1 hypothetical protein AeRB84_000128 [Aphanomyces euteiches]